MTPAAGRVPDLDEAAVRDRCAGRYAGRRTALVLLADLAEGADGTHAVWVLRGGIGVSPERWRRRWRLPCGSATLRIGTGTPATPAATGC